jgi:hypothetical protein
MNGRRKFVSVEFAPDEKELHAEKRTDARKKE